MEGNAKMPTNAYQECVTEKPTRVWEGKRVTLALAISIVTTDLHAEHQPNGHFQHNA